MYNGFGALYYYASQICHSSYLYGFIKSNDDDVYWRLNNIEGEQTMNFKFSIIYIVVLLLSLTLIALGFGLIAPGKIDVFNKQFAWNGIYPGMPVKSLTAYIKKHPVLNPAPEGKLTSRAIKDFHVYTVNVTIDGYTFVANVIDKQVSGFYMNNPPKRILKSLYMHCRKYMKQDLSSNGDVSIYTYSSPFCPNLNLRIDDWSDARIDYVKIKIEWNMVALDDKFTHRVNQLKAIVAIDYITQNNELSTEQEISQVCFPDDFSSTVTTNCCHRTITNAISEPIRGKYQLRRGSQEDK